MKRALLSVSDKTDIEKLGAALAERGWELLSTGGTARALRSAGLEVTDVAEATGHPEMMEGRVKTLHPAIHAGLLARRDRDDDLAALEAQGYGPIDLVAVNLYPFRETIAQGDVTVAEAMEQVDIGGPTMIRSAAKNHADVWVVVDPADYDGVLEALDHEDEARARTVRRRLAAKVFDHVSRYDQAVAGHLYLAGAAEDHALGLGAPVAEGPGADEERPDELPGTLTVRLQRTQTLRYGENPDQTAAFYREGAQPEGLAALEKKHGKALSYNNLLDLDGALLCVSPFAFTHRPAAVIVKHTTPCGLAVADTQAEAYEQALRCDPISAFGSIIALNRPVEPATAERISKLFVECVVAPAFTDDALEILTRKKNLRLLTFPGRAEALSYEPQTAEWADRPEAEKAAARFVAGHGRFPRALGLRSVYGGMLAQTPPLPPFYGVEDAGWSVATERQPTEAEWDDLRFAWAAVFGVKSNAILLARDGATLGIGAGQMSRVDSCRLAVEKAQLPLDGTAAASDAFFPFRDGLDVLARAGVTAVVQPGGSKRDKEVIEAANEHGIAMVTTGVRHFRH